MTRAWLAVGACFWTLAAVAVGVRVVGGNDSRGPDEPLNARLG